jgi:hypothetical protein
MTLMWKRHILVGLGLGLVLGLLLVVTLPDVGYGRERKEWSGVVPKHYPKGFSGMGYIDRIEDNEIVVDDVLFRLSTGVSYHTPKIGKASRGWFSVGKRVGFITNSKREIISLWLIVE